jgi:hypothetical protein
VLVREALMKENGNGEEEEHSGIQCRVLVTLSVLPFDQN